MLVWVSFFFGGGRLDSARRPFGDRSDLMVFSSTPFCDHSTSLGDLFIAHRAESRWHQHSPPLLCVAATSDLVIVLLGFARIPLGFARRPFYCPPSGVEVKVRGALFFTGADSWASWCLAPPKKSTEWHLSSQNTPLFRPSFGVNEGRSALFACWHQLNRWKMYAICRKKRAKWAKNAPIISF